MVLFCCCATLSCAASALCFLMPFVFLCVLCCRLLSVLCCNLDSFLLLESQYKVCDMLLQSQRENVADPDTSEGYELITTYLILMRLVIYRFNHMIQTILLKLGLVNS